jgi:transcriptional antiterminator RfaH
MPILQKETTHHPENLWTGFADDSSARSWWVLHTKSRQEKSLARELLGSEVPFFLPQVEKTAVVRGRRRSTYIPLFTSYLFLFGNEEERIRSLTTNRVVGVLPVADQSELYGDLRQVWHLIQSQAPLTVEARLSPGQRVRVMAGVLAGIEGTVLSRHRKTRLLVGVTLLQRGVSIEIDDYLLEPIG